ncbi:multicopper oxidase family protein [Pseudomonas nicosulfuronedens]|uniref:Multicopper oxidase family protein n=1 Tax=Pseudomonas nicosulfuronedens TaxID=2571105 RepID=A0A5R9R3Q5_9PSED|nr:multicopper oxidase family protein [Pseudomonas nicosulfuronedens]MDH1010702.1 multicopper oxidase family protein [Pseudomonas nicosulfuronedens]MDH1979000.1 multicopper oxidase family protein [Pseudomonas nicosulfuronedens]MDH2025901.1 multicopper oxidase family protein [Pseudomonas nicosulfuronedens]TLX77352.1 multicopper oxidase family protein [Pseudomonas nicosulfuronedens]
MSRLRLPLAALCPLAAFFLGNAFAAPLQPPPEFSYDAQGATTATLTAERREVAVGNVRYDTLVFNGQYDSPLLRLKPGGTLTLRLDNRMDDITNLHFHGMTVTPLDGGDSIFRETRSHEVGDYHFAIPANHSPGAYWYHSHFHGGSQYQVSAGIAGPIIVDGILDPFPELKGIRERVLVLRNFQKTLTGRNATEVITSAPSIRTINGQFEPTLDIQPGETQLWHFINIAANQYFRIAIDGQSMQVLSRDGNTVTRRVDAKEVLIGPSARFSVLVVGPAAGQHDITMGAANTGPAGDTYPAQRLAILNSSGAAVATKQITSAYPQVEDFRQEKVARVRQFAFQDSDSDPNTFYINGTRFDPGKVNTTVKLGDLEEWRLYNPSQELHQFHIHQTDFQVVEINGKPVRFSGYRDNVYIPATGSITLRIPFRDPVMLGKFVYHCHILEHEDGGMMQAIQVVRPEDYEQAVKLEPLGGIYGDNQTCAYLRNTGRDFDKSNPLAK